MKALAVTSGVSRRVTVTPFVWDSLPIHPAILEKPTQGRNIDALTPYEGVALVGYGDWTNNTGAVKVIGYDMGTLAPVTLLDHVPSENLSRFRVFDGVCYSPWIDPTVGNQGGYTTNEGGTWHNATIGGPNSMVHTFDIVKFGGLLYACGSVSSSMMPGGAAGTGRAVVYRRSRFGDWQAVLVTPTHTPLTRFYTFTREGGALTTWETNEEQTRKWTTTTGSDWMPGSWFPRTDPNHRTLPKDLRTGAWFPANSRLHPLSTPEYVPDLTDIPGFATDTSIWTINNEAGRVVRTTL